MTKYIMFGIYNETNQFWFNIELNKWVQGFLLDGNCLFPTFQMAQEYNDSNIQNPAAKVYKVELPINEVTFECCLING